MNYDTGKKSSTGDKNVIIEALKTKDINSLINNDLISIKEMIIWLSLDNFTNARF